MPYAGNVTTASRQVAPGQQAPLLTIPYARITFCANPPTPANAVCTNLAPVYSDQALTQPIVQPLIADAQGQFQVWVTGGTYAYSTQTPLGTYLGTTPFSGGIGGITVPPGAPFALLYRNPDGSLGSGSMVTDAKGALHVASSFSTVGGTTNPSVAQGAVPGEPGLIASGALYTNDSVNARSGKFFNSLPGCNSLVSADAGASAAPFTCGTFQLKAGFGDGANYGIGMDHDGRAWLYSNGGDVVHLLKAGATERFYGPGVGPDAGGIFSASPALTIDSQGAHASLATIGHMANAYLHPFSATSVTGVPGFNIVPGSAASACSVAGGDYTVTLTCTIGASPVAGMLGSIPFTTLFSPPPRLTGVGANSQQSAQTSSLLYSAPTTTQADIYTAAPMPANSTISWTLTFVQ